MGQQSHQLFGLIQPEIPWSRNENKVWAKSCSCKGALAGLWLGNWVLIDPNKAHGSRATDTLCHCHHPRHIHNILAPGWDGAADPEGTAVLGTGWCSALSLAPRDCWGRDRVLPFHWHRGILILGCQCHSQPHSWHHSCPAQNKLLFSMR